MMILHLLSTIQFLPITKRLSRWADIPVGVSGTHKSKVMHRLLKYLIHIRFKYSILLKSRFSFMFYWTVAQSSCFVIGTNSIRLHARMSKREVQPFSAPLRNHNYRSWRIPKQVLLKAHPSRESFLSLSLVVMEPRLAWPLLYTESSSAPLTDG